MVLDACRKHGVRGCLACAVIVQEQKVRSESDLTKEYTLYTGCSCPDFYHKFLRWYLLKQGPVPTCKHIRHKVLGEGAS